MGARARILPLATVVAAALLVSARADAKPTIYVEVSIDPADKRLREKLDRDLRIAQITASMEDFLAVRFIETFSRLEMFQFVNQRAASAVRLKVRVASKPGGLRYPREDVAMTLSLDGEREEHSITLFQKCTCGTPPCAPENLTDLEWYRSTFRRAIEQWPDGLFKSIVLTTTAKYEQGKVRTVEPIVEFGQRHMGPPSAVFEVAYGETQRWFAICQDKKLAEWNTLGFDQGNPQRFIAPVCVSSAIRGVPDGNNGRVTLMKAFLR